MITCYQDPVEILWRPKVGWRIQCWQRLRDLVTTHQLPLVRTGDQDGEMAPGACVAIVGPTAVAATSNSPGRA